MNSNVATLITISITNLILALSKGGFSLYQFQDNIQQFRSFGALVCTSLHQAIWSGHASVQHSQVCAIWCVQVCVCTLLFIYTHMHTDIHTLKVFWIWACTVLQYELRRVSSMLSLVLAARPCRAFVLVWPHLLGAINRLWEPNLHMKGQITFLHHFFCTSASLFSLSSR